MGELQGELNAMSKQGRWKEMGTLITDDMINAFGVMGEPQQIAPEMLPTLRWVCRPHVCFLPCL
jgi:hypothetical protein